MKIQTGLNSKYLKAENDIGKVGSTKGLTITNVRLETFDDGKKSYVLSFEETERELSLNATNLGTLIALYGDDDSGWKGQKVTLKVELVRNPSGQMVPGIRVAV